MNLFIANQYARVNAAHVSCEKPHKQRLTNACAYAYKHTHTLAPSLSRTIG